MPEHRWPIRYDSVDDLPSIIPVFPLDGAVFFPRANLPLNIFEPRYLAMIDDAMRGTRLIGMIQPSGGPDVKPSLYRVGTVGRITSYTETDDGRMVISLRGISRFEVTDELAVMTPYRQAQVDYAAFAADLDDIDVAEAEARFDRTGYLATLRQYLRTIAVQIDWDWVEKAPTEILINAFAMLAPLSSQEKQALLEAKSLEERTRGALTLMELAVAEAAASSSGGGAGLN